MWFNKIFRTNETLTKNKIATHYIMECPPCWFDFRRSEKITVTKSLWFGFYFDLSLSLSLSFWVSVSFCLSVCRFVFVFIFIYLSFCQKKPLILFLPFLSLLILSLSLSLSLTHTHTHTYIYIYTYIRTLILFTKSEALKIHNENRPRSTVNTVSDKIKLPLHTIFYQIIPQTF